MVTITLIDDLHSCWMDIISAHSTTGGYSILSMLKTYMILFNGRATSPFYVCASDALHFAIWSFYFVLLTPLRTHGLTEPVSNYFFEEDTTKICHCYGYANPGAWILSINVYGGDFSISVNQHMIRSVQVHRKARCATKWQYEMCEKRWAFIQCENHNHQFNHRFFARCVLCAIESSSIYSYFICNYCLPFSSIPLHSIRDDFPMDQL